MKTKTITLYEYSELSEKAKEKAFSDYNNSQFDGYELNIAMDNEIEYLLGEAGITPVKTSDGKYPSKYATVQYSLGYSQGDGVMFEGVFNWKKYVVTIKHEGHYCHSYSKSIEMVERDDREIVTVYASEKVQAKFEKIYQEICKKLEKYGYECIEDMQSEGHFIEDCNANEWTFREDGTMENA